MGFCVCLVKFNDVMIEARHDIKTFIHFQYML